MIDSELTLLKTLQQAELELGFNSKQFSGAISVELIKQVLIENNFTTSEKDVFIKNIPIEIDLLIVKPGSKPKYGGLLWSGSDVIAAFEMKKSGCVIDSGKVKVNSDFGRIKTFYPHIKIFYVTISEVQTKIAEVIKKSDENFTFFIRRNGKYSSTGDFDRFIQKLSFQNHDHNDIQMPE